MPFISYVVSELAILSPSPDLVVFLLCKIGSLANFSLNSSLINNYVVNFPKVHSRKCLEKLYIFSGLAVFDVLNCLVFMISGSIPSLLTRWDLTTNKTWPGHPVTYPIGNMAFTGKYIFLDPIIFTQCSKGGTKVVF